MSVIKTYTAWESVEISISPSEVSKSDLNDLANVCEKAFTQKMEKLSTLTKSMNVYAYENALLINDEYSTCSDFMDVVTSLGFVAKEVQCGLRGRSYVLTDPIIDSLLVINPNYNMQGNFEKPNDDIANAIKHNSVHQQFETEVKSIIKTLVAGKDLKVTGRQEVITTKDEWAGHGTRTLSVDRGEIKSDEKTRVTGMAKNFFSDLQGKLDNVNSQLQDGTVSILNSRAKKLGYTIQQQRKGKNVELVYERIA